MISWFCVNSLKHTFKQFYFTMYDIRESVRRFLKCNYTTYPELNICHVSCLRQLQHRLPINVLTSFSIELF